MLHLISLNTSLPLMINCIYPAVSPLLNQAACSCCVSCLCSVTALVTSTDTFFSERFHCCFFDQLPNVSVIIGKDLLNINPSRLTRICLRLAGGLAAAQLSNKPAPVCREGWGAHLKPWYSFSSLLQSAVEAKYP